MTTTTPVDSDLQQQDDHESHGHGHGEHPDLRMFGLATFLVADGMTFRRLLCRLPHLPGRESPTARGDL